MQVAGRHPPALGLRKLGRVQEPGPAVPVDRRIAATGSSSPGAGWTASLADAGDTLKIQVPSKSPEKRSTTKTRINTAFGRILTFCIRNNSTSQEAARRDLRILAYVF
jgi:hypothetical protein